MRYENGMTERDLADLVVLDRFTVTVDLIEQLAARDDMTALRLSRIEEGIEWDQ